MAEIVNLRQARKRKARDAADAVAAANRRKHGVSKAERRLAQIARALEDKRLDGLRREPAADES